jgi:K+-sensing histidine kinase KdpD
MGIHSLSEMVQSALAIVNSSLLNKQIGVDLDVAADCYLEVDKTAFINSVLVNALTNAIKFSQPHDHIQITDFRDGDQIGFVIRDYGTGMPKEIVEQLMGDKEIPSTKGTLEEAGVGYGLKLMKKFTDMFMGEIRITSSETNPGEGFIGTNIEFRFSDS